MHLVRTRPFRLPDDVDALLDMLPHRTAPRFGLREGHLTRRPWLPRVDVIETQDTLVVVFELAGFRRQDLEVALDDNLLTVKGTRSADGPEDAVFRIREIAEGSFSRSIRTPEVFDLDHVEAGFSDGILKIVLGKRTDVLPRTIPIESAIN